MSVRIRERQAARERRARADAGGATLAFGRGRRCGRRGSPAHGHLSASTDGE